MNKKVMPVQGDEPPAKCAESQMTRYDGGIKSPSAAEANLSGKHPLESEMDWVEGCTLNEKMHGAVQGGPAPSKKNK